MTFKVKSLVTVDPINTLFFFKHAVGITSNVAWWAYDRVLQDLH